MNVAQSLLYILSLISCSAAICKKICVLDNIDCVTKGAFVQYKTVVGGIKDLEVDPMDPLHIERIEDRNGSMQYNISNIELRGLKDCIVTKLMLNVTEEDFKSYFTCPNLNATFNYEANGTSCLGDDKVVLTVCDYRILNVGHYGILVDERDLMPHFFIKNVLPKIYLREKFTLEIKSRLYGHAGSISKEIAEYFFSLIVKTAMRVLFHGIDVNIRHQAMGDIFPGSNMKKQKKHYDK